MKSLLDRALTERIVWTDPDCPADVAWRSGLEAERKRGKQFLPRHVYDIQEIVDRGVLSSPARWEPELLRAYDMAIPRHGLWLEWDAGACWLDTRPPIDGSGGEAAFTFVPVRRLADGGCLMVSPALIVGLSAARDVSAPAEWRWDTRIYTIASDGRHIVEFKHGIATASATAVSAAWYGVATLILLAADGIAVRTGTERPGRWTRRYMKRHGEPPAQRERIALAQPELKRDERGMAFHYTRSHTKFFSGELGHRYFGRSEPQTITVPGFWSGNIDQGISIDRFDMP